MRQTVPKKVHKALLVEDERHRLAKLAIVRGWTNRGKLADAFGMATVGAPYDKGDISNALNGRRYPGLAAQLEEFMMAHPGPDLLDEAG